MSDTLADIVRKLRKEADALKVDETCQDLDLIHEEWNHTRRDRLRALADRIEAAWKREVADALDTGAFVEAAHKRECGNAAKMREALEKVSRWLEGGLAYCHRRRVGEVVQVPAISAFYVLDAVKAALSAPLRNCDVGTVKEQVDRFRAYCRTQTWKEGWKKDPCENCALFKNGDGAYGAYCEFAWAQLPYEEGGAK